MAGANDGARLGAVVDRGLVAERIAARTAPLPPFVRTASPDAVSPAAAILVDEVDLARVERIRAGSGVSLLAFVARAAVDAHGRGPVHLGTATGLVRDAGSLRLRALASALTGAAPGDGATLTLVESGARLAAVPGAGPVLTVGQVEVRPVARRTGDEWTLALRPTAALTLCFDAAALPEAGTWLTGIKDRLEQRDWEAEL